MKMEFPTGTEYDKIYRELETFRHQSFNIMFYGDSQASHAAKMFMLSLFLGHCKVNNSFFYKSFKLIHGFWDYNKVEFREFREFVPQ